MISMLAWFSAFVVTQLIECPIYRIALKHRTGPWLWAFGASLITHPIVYFGFSAARFDSYVSMLSWAEAFAVLAEAIYLQVLGVRFSILWALGANILSAAIGLGLRSLIGWP